VQDLSGTPVKDIRPPNGLTALELHRLRRTKVINLEPLKDLTALKGLDLNGTNITDEQVKGLQKLLPNVRIDRWQSVLRHYVDSDDARSVSGYLLRQGRFLIVVARRIHVSVFFSCDRAKAR
jgi:hypothetical protein